MIRVVCGCGRVFRAEERHSGLRTRCPACGARLTIGAECDHEPGPTIPRTPPSGPGEAGTDAPPSWWSAGATADGSGFDLDLPVEPPHSEAIATTVLEPNLTSGATPAASGDAERPSGIVPAHHGRASRNLAGSAVLLVALALGLIYAKQWGIPGSVPAPEARPARPGVSPPGPARHPAEVAVRDGADNPEDGRAAGTRPAPRVRLLVPAYFYPSADGRAQWRRLIDAAGRADLVAIVNPDSGPGGERNPDYADVIAEAADRGVRLVGYINTRYAERPASEVKQDVDDWVRLYPRIAGIFLDQQPPDAHHAPYIVDIAGHARAKIKDALVITDPGVPCDDSYLSRRAADTACIFANAGGFSAFELPANLRVHDPSRYAALVYQVADAAEMRATLEAAVLKRIGWVYVTDGKGANPWDRLPAYWDAEVDAAARLR